jgi:hypothetical protein
VAQRQPSPSRVHAVTTTFDWNGGQLHRQRLQSAFNTKEAPSNTSSSWPPTWLT